MVPQYPNGVNKNSFALPRETWQFDKKPANLHQASTGMGSSGAPLLQQISTVSGSGRNVLGLHPGFCREEMSNLAIKIESIIEDLTILLLGEKSCIPLHIYLESRDSDGKIKPSLFIYVLVEPARRG